MPALAQENHALHHASYENWVNQQERGCCNDMDCGELRDDDERTSAGIVEVRVEGQWCPVKPWMYLKRGNAPNWSTSHVCVIRPYRGDDADEPLPPCQRLICYQPKPQF